MFGAGGGAGTPTSNYYSHLREYDNEFPHFSQPKKRFRETNNKIDKTLNHMVDIENNNQYDGPRYILMTRFEIEKQQNETKLVESSFLNTSPIQIQKSIDAKLSKLENVKKLRNGKLLLLTKNRKQANLALNTTKIGNWTIKCEDHKQLNTTKGVIYCKDMLEETEEEICDYLKKDNVIEVRRIKRKQLGTDVITNTPLLILTFDTPNQVKEIKLGYQVTEVREYIPNPRRCMKCQKFGHIQKICNRQEVCSMCLENNHRKENCAAKAPICANCDNVPPHQSSSRSCPTFLEEMNIQKIMARTKKPYKEAKIMNGNMTKENISYAATTANSVSTENNKNSTQTPSTTPKLPEKHLTATQQINLMQNDKSLKASTIHTETIKSSTSNTNTLIPLINKTQEIINENPSTTNTNSTNSSLINTNVSIQEERNSVMETDELLIEAMNQNSTSASVLSTFFKKNFNTTIIPIQSEETTTRKNRPFTADTMSLDNTVTNVTVEVEPEDDEGEDNIDDEGKKTNNNTKNDINTLKQNNISRLRPRKK